ncbi:carbohydrate ABC transporter permease [Haloferax sp. DFSO52]|uniref:carbohydrate ABC transporter permease n=1 Tax=Haloferax sp. DFSO52 TaxID=3388505 RepID=UPI003A84AFEF
MSLKERTSLDFSLPFRSDGLETDPSWYAIVLPKVIVFSAILIVPFFGAVYISLHQWDPLAATHPFIGLENYVQLFQDPVFWISLKNTIGFSLGLLLIDVPIALGLALLLDKNLRGTRFYSTAIFLPVVTSWVVVSLIWTWIYNPNYGLLNTALRTVGLPTFEWLNSTDTALLSIILMSIWKHIGFNMVLFLSGLKSIPDVYYEAAKMDGATRFNRFRYITLPLLKSTSVFVVIVTMILSFRLFTQVFVMTGGGPVNSSYSLVFYFYEQGFSQFKMGYASALAVVLFVVVFVLSLLQQKSWGDDVEY